MFYIEEHEKMTQIEDRSDEIIDAAAKGDVETVKKLLESGMHPDTQGPKGWTALRMAAVGNKYEVAYVLLHHGANVDAVNYTGKTALMMACVYDHYEMVTLLLFYGADPNLANCGGRTALMIAASYGYLRLVGALLDKSPLIDLGKTDHNGNTALDLAIKYGYDNVAKMLAAAGGKHSAKRSARYAVLSGGGA